MLMHRYIYDYNLISFLPTIRQEEQSWQIGKGEERLTPCFPVLTIQFCRNTKMAKVDYHCQRSYGDL